jgi:hypothetical protein
MVKSLLIELESRSAGNILWMNARKESDNGNYKGPNNREQAFFGAGLLILWLLIYFLAR